MRCPHRRGFSLLELLIALTLGLTLVAAYFGALQRNRGEFTENESLAQLHDAARHALGVLAADIEHAGFFGFAPAASVELVKNDTVLATQDDMRQPAADLAVLPVPGLPDGAHDCGVNFAVDLLRAVQATDNGHAVADDCEPAESAGGVRASADTLTLRHASLQVTESRAGRLQVLSRAASSQPLRLFADGRVPRMLDAPSEVRDLVVRTYYVANQSVGNPRLPALRVKSLTESRGSAQFRDEEVMPGVEDLQVELGYLDVDEASEIPRFVTADSPVAASARVVAVRVWLRVRAEAREPGYREDRSFVYSNIDFTPTGSARGHRRLLVTRTIALRNGP